jgi:hypothetical protein
MIKKLLLIGFVSLVLIVTGFIVSGLYSLRKSEAYQFAKEYVKNSPEVNKKVGGVEGFGFMVGGEKSPGKAHLSFSVEGKVRDVGVIIDLHKESDGWKVDKLSYY